ncbi:MAG: hypothetical protein ACI3YB_02040 [Prevotella sp.]
MKKNDTNIKIGRSKEGTVFEIVTLVLVVIMWVLAIMKCFSGSDESGAGCRKILPNAAVGTFCAAICLISSYRPATMVNLPFKVERPAQYLMMSRMSRTLAPEMTLLFISLILWMGENNIAEMCFYAMIFIILSTCIGYSILIYRK